MRSKRGHIWAVTACAVVLAGACSSTSSDTRTGTPVKAGTDKTVALAARKQAAATSFVVDDVNLSGPGYVGVYDDGNGAPGVRVGSSALLSKGDHRNVTVTLSKAPLGALVYLVAHHEDNGNSHLDFPSGDKPFVSTSGVVLVKVAVTHKK